MEDQKAKEILEKLERCTGSETIFKHPMAAILPDGAVFTEGIMLMAQLCKAFWLLDIPFSYQLESHVRNVQGQIWKLEVNKDDDSGVVTMVDYYGKEKVRQEIPFTDFPLTEITMYLIGNTLCLPSEN